MNPWTKLKRVRSLQGIECGGGRGNSFGMRMIKMRSRWSDRVDDESVNSGDIDGEGDTKRSF